MSKFTTISQIFCSLIEYSFGRHLLAFMWLVNVLIPNTRMYGQWHLTQRCDSSRVDSLAYSDIREIQNILQQQYQDMLNKGYLECRIDTAMSDSTIYYCIESGKQFQIDSIIILHPNQINTINVFRKSSTIPFSFNTMTLTGMNPLKDYNEHGYPFVSLQLDTIRWHNTSATIQWHIEKGECIRMDSLYIRSDDRIPVHYLRRSLQWQKGKLYSESTLLQADERIQQIPFLKIAQASAVRFTSSGAQLIVYPMRKPANTFQGILGIRPNDATGKINLTGDVELRLWNGLNTGEELYLNWRKLQSQTQDLEAKANFSYLFGTAFGADALIKIYKRDSSFVSIKLNGGINWKPNLQTTLRGFAEKFTATTLKPSFLFPENSNVSAVYYGINYYFNGIDRPNNPRKGFMLKGEVAMGVRNKVFVSATDSGRRVEKYQAARAELEMKLFIPTFKKQCIMLGNYSSSLQTDSIGQNEMYRIGGLRSMRGIDEESILASSFTITTLEYRYLIDEQTAVYLFSDLSWWEGKSRVLYDRDTPYSFGAGLNLKTNSGVFTFNYAIAKQFDNPVLLRNAKVSFGFRSVF